MTNPGTANSEETSNLLESPSTCSLVSSANGVNPPSVCSLDGSMPTCEGDGEEQKNEKHLNPYNEPDTWLPGPVPGSWDATEAPGALAVTSHLSMPDVTESESAAPSSSMPPQAPSDTDNTNDLLRRAGSWLPGWLTSKANNPSLLEQTRDELATCRKENRTMQSEIDEKDRTIRELLDAEAQRLQESAMTTWIKDTVVTTIARILGMVDRVVIKPPQALHERMTDQDWYKNTKSRVSGFSVWPLLTAVGSTAVSNLPSTVGSAASSVGAAASSAVSGLTEQATKSYNAAWRWGSSYLGGDSEVDGGSARKSEVTEPTGPAHTKPPIVI